MSAPRIPLPGAALRGAARVVLPPEAVRHLTVVLRLAEGAPVVVFDGDGREADARLARVDGEWAAELAGEVRAGRTGAPLTLCYALPKGDKLETVARQCTELGVGGLLLVAADRSVVRLEGDRADRRLERLARVLAEAARQCGRADVPDLAGPLPVAAAAARVADHETRLVLHPEGGEPLSTPSGRTALFVGPEGGFSPAELAALDAAGCRRVSLASPVLRTETAAAVGCALVLHRMGAL